MKRTSEAQRLSKADGSSHWRNPPKALMWGVVAVLAVAVTSALPPVTMAEEPGPLPFFSVSPIEPAEHMWGEEWALDSEVLIEIDDPDTGEAVDFSMTAGTDGNGRFELYDMPFDIEAGHVVTVSQGATVKTHVVIDLTVTLMDPVRDTVSGVGAPNTETVVVVWDGQLQESSQRIVMSDDAGAWTAEFSSAFDIQPRMMTYTYQADEDADQTQIDAWPPTFWVTRDWNGLVGDGWPAEAGLHVTADDPATGVDPDIELTLATNAEGFFEGAGVFPGLQPGWLITVTDGVTTKTHTVRDISITDVDPAADIMRGTADAGTEVWVSVDYAAGYWLTADGSGEWLADFSGDYDITFGSEVGVSQYDEDGDFTYTIQTVLVAPIPPGTSLTTPGHGTATSGTPTVYWSDPLTVSTTASSGATVTAALTVFDGSGYVQTIALDETPPASGTYMGTFAAPFPHHGAASISITIGGTAIAFDLYIDPSGVVRDTFGDPVVGATVTLYRSDDPGGPFVAVPGGSAIMSPGNRTNPDLTGADGLFGWDAIAGYYKVRAEKAGCSAPGGGAFVETDVLTIPPPVTDLALVLYCLVDNDADGIPDGSDSCPDEAEDADGFEDSDGCPDPDNDSDGVLDASDACPNKAEDMDVFRDGDGCPEPCPGGDVNGDGRVDFRDLVLAARAFGSRPGDRHWNPAADINHNGRVDLGDLITVFRSSFDRTCRPAA